MIPDPIEALEAAAERHYDRSIGPDGMMHCECGAYFDCEKEGGLITPNPYAMPVCGKCYAEVLAHYQP